MSSNLFNVSYAVGLNIAESLKSQQLDELDTEAIAKAINDFFSGKEILMDPETANNYINQFLQEKSMAAYEANKVNGEQFLATNGQRPEVVTTASGLQYEVLTEGNGSAPSATDTVTVHYHGTLTDGTVFDSSITRGTPASFGVHQVIPGWTEALQLMNVGAKYRLYIPQELAYGAHPHPGGPIQPFSALVFDVELLDIK